MAKEILVPIKSNEGIEDLIPFIETVMQPGTKVVFVISCQAGSSFQMNQCDGAATAPKPAQLVA